MNKKNFFKWFAPLGLMVAMFGCLGSSQTSALAQDTGVYTTPPAVITATRKQVNLTNPKLNQVIRSMLGKNANENLYSDAFVTNAKFQETAENPIYQLDFSNTGITDIRELIQFEIPSHIGGINLAGNGITNDHLQSIVDTLNCTVDSTIVIGDVTYTAVSDISSIIKKVNLNDNNIDLNTINSSYLSDTKLIFGVQCMNVPQSTLVMPGEVTAMYYIRSNSDQNYLTFTFTQEYSTNVGKIVPHTPDVVTKVANETIFDRYTITVSSIPNTPTAYFNGYEYFQEFTQFNISLDSDFKVERKNLLDLRVTSEGQLLSDSPININGFGNNSSLFVTYNNASTSRITSETYKNYVNITLEHNNHTRTIPLEFIVEDTIKPVIVLKGSSHAYSSKNKDYKDPGVIAYDPSTTNAETGDDLTAMVITANQVDVTKIGQYKIIYRVTDSAGNYTTAERLVDIQEQVLDTIILKTTTTELVNGGDIVLIVQPDNNVEIKKYSNITYYWYMNDVLFQETKGDNITGKSSITIVGDTSIAQNIYVKLEAVQNSDYGEIIVYSNLLELDVKASMNNNTTIILAVGIVVLVALAIMIIMTVIKARKSKGKTHGKHKNFVKGKKPKNDPAPVQQEKKIDIQVVKDYKGPTDAQSEVFNGGGNTDAKQQPPAEQEPPKPNKSDNPFDF